MAYDMRPELEKLSLQLADKYFAVLTVSILALLFGCSRYLLPYGELLVRGLDHVFWSFYLPLNVLFAEVIFIWGYNSMEVRDESMCEPE